MNKLIKVKMLVDTNFGGQRLHTGDEVSVKEEVGKRWASRGIAKLIASPSQDEETTDLNKLTAKQLFDMCVSKGIKTEARLSKAEYISLLNQEA